MAGSKGCGETLEWGKAIGGGGGVAASDGVPNVDEVSGDWNDVDEDTRAGDGEDEATGC